MLDVKKYRRLHPKIRLSYSLYYNYVRKDWQGIWDYLLGIKRPVSAAAKKGIKEHEEMTFKAISKKLLSIEEKFFGNKTDGKDYLKEEKFVLDHPHARNGFFGQPERPYEIVMIADLLTDNMIVDYKTGKLSGYEQQLNAYGYILSELGYPRQYGLLAHITNGEIDRTQLYKLTNLDHWGNVFETMYQDIMGNWKGLESYAKNI